MAQQLRLRNGARSSIVGPTIKSNSRLAAYFPDIPPQKGMIIKDEGYIEPHLTGHDSDMREIDGINFWSGTD